jgi:ornithine cyclodeaminase
VHEREVTLFDSVGFALEDFSALRYLRRVHQEARGLKQQIDLVPDIENPKDLYGLLLDKRGLTPRPAAVLA